MPKKLIPSGWVGAPCQYLLPVDSTAAANCGECGEEFTLWNGRRHCMFCGYIFHRNSCTSKVPVAGQFFRQRICSSCHYYRTTAGSLLTQGEDFECLNSSGCGEVVHISLCENTAELQLFWKNRVLKETFDLSRAEVRKGISHVAAAGLDTSVASYDPLRCFTLFLQDPLGDQTTCQLKAPSAITCHRWVESVKCARYVYGRMLEQACAEEQFLEVGERSTEMGEDKSPRWYQRRYLPVALAPVPSPQFSEEWDNIPLPGTTTEASEACGFDTSAVFPFPPGHGASLGTSHSSSYLSDLSFSLHSNHQVLPRWPVTLHHTPSSKSSRKRHTSSHSSTSSLPSTPGLQYTSTTRPVRSLPPSGVPTSSSCSTPRLPSSCSCHATRPVSSESRSSRPQSAGSWLSSHLPSWSHTSATPSNTDNCCDSCRSYCKLAAELDS